MKVVDKVNFKVYTVIAKINKQDSEQNEVMVHDPKSGRMDILPASQVEEVK